MCPPYHTTTDLSNMEVIFTQLAVSYAPSKIYNLDLPPNENLYYNTFYHFLLTFEMSTFVKDMYSGTSLCGHLAIAVTFSQSRIKSTHFLLIKPLQSGHLPIPNCGHSRVMISVH
jgi:hypothetical protein